MIRGDAATAAPVLDRVVRWADRGLLAAAALALVAMMVHINLDVLSGLLFNSPIPLTSAIVTEYYMIAVALLPLASGEYRNVHTSVDLLVNRLPAGPRAALDVAVRVLCVVGYFLLAGQAWQQALEKYASNAYLLEQTSRIVVWPAYFLIPIGFAAIAALIAVKLACRLLGREEPAAPGDAEPDSSHV